MGQNFENGIGVGVGLDLEVGNQENDQLISGTSVQPYTAVIVGNISEPSKGCSNKTGYGVTISNGDSSFPPCADSNSIPTGYKECIDISKSFFITDNENETTSIEQQHDNKGKKRLHEYNLRNNENFKRLMSMEKRNNTMIRGTTNVFICDISSCDYNFQKIQICSKRISTTA